MSAFLDKLNTIRADLEAQRANLTDEEVRSLNAQRADNDRAFAFIFLGLACVSTVFFAFYMESLAPYNAHGIHKGHLVAVASLYFLGIVLGWLRVHWVITIAKIAVPLNLICFGLLTFFNWYYLASLDHRIIGSVLLLYACVSAIMAYPSQNHWIPGLWLSIPTIIIAGWYAPRFDTLIAAAVFTLLLFSAIRAGIALTIEKNHIKLILIKRMAVDEEIKRQQFEYEMARQIQQSYVGNKNYKLDGGVKISTYHIPFGKVGGDWFMIKTQRDRALVITADVSGKGLQAALVVHAIQSLWAAHCKKEINPGEWLEMVNDTLLLMGKKTLHTASVGIVEVGQDRCIFWGAASPPAIVVRGGGQTSELVFSRGSLLGVGEKIKLAPKTIPMDWKAGDAMLFGSDGVICREGVWSQASCNTILSQLATTGSAALDAIQVNDDKTLISITKAA